MTPDKNGMNPRSEAVPLTIEAQYAAGFNWARQAGLRFVNKLSDESSFGIGLEESQTLFSGTQRAGELRHRPDGRAAAQRHDHLLDRLLA